MDSKQKSSITSQSQLEKLSEQLIVDFLKKNNYQYGNVLGSGDFSQVVSAFSLKYNCKVAIKILKKIKNQKEIDLVEFQKEISILQMLKDEKYVLQILEKIQDDDSGMAGLVTELCDCNLTKIIELNKFNIEQIRAITFQLLKGLLTLQEIGIIHSDIKPDNILYSRSKNSFMIADYGLSKVINDPSSQKTLSSLQGNMKYMSPEVMNREKPYTIAVDVYSIGLLLTEIFLQRELLPKEWISLSMLGLLQALPSLNNSDHSEFVQAILSNMVQPEVNSRLEPVRLLQNLRKSQIINENSLKSLRIPEMQLIQKQQPIQQKELKKLYVDQLKDAVKGIDYDIVEINLSNNNLGVEGTKVLATSIEKCQNITSLNLNLYNNNLGVEGTKVLATSIEKCQNITSLNLNLSLNNLGVEGTKVLATSIEKCQNITSLNLNLSDNGLDETDKKNIRMILERYKNISSLELKL